ncbi:winged helix DNA-binding domain-containing protein [Jidongwangia harbinensis]|uniref:winged helix DNA-binding domain-containing protein n=1 Tax=Jidongwangia harbinensis TaxID=2878561 RepID=UPI001CD99315|nr:winged helix DNA-binding domain-containing protein [Jidongwangia harbinensis]MCA2212755.1 winged helix DNA-binding domain-containing protein [Jidongwangia harbinensis]
MRLRWADVSARRRVRSHLVEPRPGVAPAEVAAALLGVHAQVMSAAELSIGVRQSDGTRAGVRAALWEHRTLVKTRGPRGTVHLLAAADLPMWTGALSSVPSAAGPLPPDVRMDAAQTDSVVAAIADAVGGADAALTVDELTAAIVARVGSWAGDRVMEAFQDRWPRWRQIESVAMNRGALCFGPDRGRRATYTDPRRWLPGFAPAPSGTAVTELVRRFLHGYGPATPAQFGRWLGAPPGWAAEVFAGQGAIEQVDFDGTPAWVNAGDTGTAEGQAGLRLLPYFDAYVIGCHPRAGLFPDRAADRALAGGQAGNVPTVLIDGVVRGVWHQRRSGRRIAVTVEPFVRLTAAQRASLAGEVHRIGLIGEGTAELTLGPVTAGPHA